ncbi:MAG: hypothetical protein DMD41_10985 [Gemmatimonadetes bacterium]|nr:MAG: hypothetical protein AUH46_00130 [Gemmatimonadetes bacterium 13_1_40CM_70_15]PYP71863.1 MAG: hypothetical protein DMD41_10985 [Gemmatimonadota bacterium]
MKKIAVLFAMLLAVGAAAAAAQARWRVSVGFGAPRPYVSGFVFVRRAAPLVVHRPRYRRPALVVVEPAPLFVYPRLYVFERGYVKRFRGRFRPYRPVRACWTHHRCGY